MSYDYHYNLGNDAKVRYEQKLALVGLDQCPYKLPSDVWVEDPTKWPELEYPDLYNYLVNTPGKCLWCPLGMPVCI